MSTIPQDTAPADVERARREQLVKDVRALADFLEQHPEIPVYSVSAYEYVFGPLEQRTAALRTALALGEIEVEPHGDVKVAVQIGPDVQYRLSADAKGLAKPSVVNDEVVWSLDPSLFPSTDETPAGEGAGA